MAQNVYATQADLSVPTKALEDFTSGELDAALAKASSAADGYIRKRFNLPLRTSPPGWTQSLTQAVADIATYWLMKKRGFNPDNESTKLIVQAYKDALEWLEDVASNVKVDPGFVDASGQGQDETSTTDTEQELPFTAYSSTRSGWGGSGSGGCGDGGGGFWG